MQGHLDQAIPGLEDHWRWDRLLGECGAIEGLTDDDRARARSAIAVLRRELGEDFLAESWLAGHPLPSFLTNSAPWTRKWLVWFGDALDHASRQTNYQSLLQRLKDGRTYGEAVSVLEVHSRFAGVGFSVQFDPTVIVGGVRKKPDLLAVNPSTNEEVFIEVTDLRNSDMTSQASDTARVIADLLIFGHPDLKHAGRIHKSLSRRHLADVAEKVATFLESVESDPEFRSLALPGVIDLGASPPNAEAGLAAWAAARDLAVGELIGPPFEFEEVRRVKNAIRNKRLQIPDTGTGVVVIRASGILYEGKDVPTLFSELEEGVFDFEKILAAVVIAGWTGAGQNAVRRHNEHAVVQSVRHDVRVENAFFVFNRYYANGLSEETIGMVRRAYGIS